MHQQSTVEAWKRRFRAVGLDEEGMMRWHALFEQEDPQGHQAFLEWLGIPAEHILGIRKGQT